MKRYNNIIVLAPHTDDEVACGGLLSRLRDKYILVVAFSYPINVPSLPNEFINSCTIIGAKSHILKYPVRNFPSVRQEICETIHALSKAREWDLVLCPSTTDTHQDHEVINREAFRSFKRTTILGYEMRHNEPCGGNSRVFIELSDIDIIAKMTMAEAYVSQKDRQYFRDKYIKRLAEVNGEVIGRRYVEQYEPIRIIL